MGCSQGQQMHFTTTGAMLGHCLLYFPAATFHHLCAADWTHPDAAAGLQTAIAGSLVLLGLPHLHVTIVGANTQAFCSSGIGKDVAGHRLKREAFHPSGHGISGRGR